MVTIILVAHGNDLDQVKIQWSKILRMSTWPN